MKTVLRAVFMALYAGVTEEILYVFPGESMEIPVEEWIFSGMGGSVGWNFSGSRQP